MSEPRRAGLDAGLGAGLGAACLAIAAGLLLHQAVTTTQASGGPPAAGCIEARGRSGLAADFAAIAYLRHPLGLANYLGRTARHTRSGDRV